MERKQFEIACPCCSSLILVDVRTGQILRTRKATPLDEAGRPVGSQGDWNEALGRVQGRKEGGQSKLDAALDREKRREQDLDDLFKRAKKRPKRAIRRIHPPPDPPAVVAGATHRRIVVAPPRWLGYDLRPMNPSRYQAVKAYKNQAFLNSPDARLLRILSEYLEPQARFRELQIRDTIVIFGSARILSREQAEAELTRARSEAGDVERAEVNLKMSHYYEATRELAFRLTEWSKGLEGNDRRFAVCSGGGPGIMEAANRGASEAKGVNVGLNISLPFEQEGNPYITRRLAFEFHYFFMRKYWFAYLAKAIVAMPGGFGTFDEFMEVVTLIQTFKIKKRMPVVLFGNEYWNEVVDFDAMAKWGTISPEDLELFHRTDSVDDAFEYITGELAHYLTEKVHDDGEEAPVESVG